MRTWGIYLMPRDVAAGKEGFILIGSAATGVWWRAHRIGPDGNPEGHKVGNPGGHFRKLPDLIAWLGWKHTGAPVREPEPWEWEDPPKWLKVTK